MTDWIDVKQELPEDQQWVLATDLDDIYILKFYQTTDRRHKNRKGYFEDHGDGWALEITHWMPLPDMPKKDVVYG